MDREKAVKNLMTKLVPSIERFQRENSVLIDAIYFVVEKTWVEKGEIKYNQRIDVKLAEPKLLNEDKK